MCTYLQPRGRTYYFRRAIPAELRQALGGKTEFMFSLRTKDRDAAKLLIPHHTIETDRLLAGAQAQMALNTPQNSRGEAPAVCSLVSTEGVQRAPTSPERARYEAAAFENMIESFELAREEAAAQEARREAREEEHAYWRKRIGFTTRELTPREAAVKDMIADKDFDLELARAEIAHLKTTLRQAKAARDPDLLAKMPAAGVVGILNERSIGVPLLATFDAYAAGQLKPNTRAEWRAVIEKLVAFLGHDDAARITTDDLYRWTEGLVGETTKRNKPRGAGTVKRGYLTPVRATLGWAVERRKLQTNAASSVRIRIPKAQKLRERDFTASEAAAILAGALKPIEGTASAQHALAQRWIPWLCAYTGARVNEISQLRSEDVQQIEGIWAIRITPEAGTVKANTARTVPLHPHLIEQGFPAVVQSAATGPLFYDPSRRRSLSDGNRQFKKVGERLADWVRKDIGITDPGLQPNHGWRHTFKSMTRAAGIQERIADAIQGHAAKTVGQSYGSVPLKTLSEAICTLPRFDVS